MSELGWNKRVIVWHFRYKNASLKLKSDLFDKYPVEEIENENHYLFNPPTNYFAKHIDGIIKIYDKLSNKIKSIYTNNKFPIIMFLSFFSWRYYCRHKLYLIQIKHLVLYGLMRMPNRHLQHHQAICTECH